MYFIVYVIFLAFTHLQIDINDLTLSTYLSDYFLPFFTSFTTALYD